ncbi:nitrate- and nitrite sensing domain-containing protein [Amycolatopsis rhabdoformis]|uniref:Nitrate- and nitrite sensing domain-containing protein n=1 Tax=Amycolatopsis rhabdoformis TaxID=1448059 RepID=A0ABZ1I2H1_9PSEU|nr:nitrate- and nitrite sensing domain-containing protein [Amycolatopsis rhabdoformis]WSE28574.1 nitrate- and nitrite sensing domain-containing protein [Amycolatopsis rhabdoformis]
MEYLRRRVVLIAFVPGAALVLVALVIGIFLVQQANRVRGLADDTARASNEVTRTVVGLQERRGQALTGDDRLAAFTGYTQRIDGAIAGLREFTRSAPDAETAYQQNTAVDLLVATEGLYRADSLAVAGLDGATRGLFTDAVGGYRTALSGVAGRLTESGRERYEALVRGADWSTLTAVENALASAAPLPVAASTWRAAVAVVGRGLGELFAQQNTFAVQLTIDHAHRTLGGALAGGAAIVVFAAVVLAVAVRLADRLTVGRPRLASEVAVAVVRRRRAGSGARWLWRGEGWRMSARSSRGGWRRSRGQRGGEWLRRCQD